MNRQQKELVVESLREGFTQSEASFLVNYKGLSVAQLQSLRRSLRDQGGTMCVAKARLMARAVSGMDAAEDMKSMFKDQVALVFSTKDPVSIAKVLSSFAKDSEKLSMVAGVIESRLFDAQDIDRLASLPSKEILVAQLLGVLQMPTRQLVSVLHMQIVRLLVVLKKIAEKGKAAN